MKKSDTYKGNFLKADALQIGPGKWTTKIVTIAGLRSGNFDDGTEQRVASFHECEEELGLNVTNWDNLDQLTGGTGDDDNFIGAKIELYVDPTVKFKGKPSPAIRIRKAPDAAPSTAPANKPAASGAAPPPPDDAGGSPPPPDDKFAHVNSKATAWDAVYKMLAVEKSQVEITDIWKKSIIGVEASSKKNQGQFTADDSRSVAEAADLPF